MLPSSNGKAIGRLPMNISSTLIGSSNFNQGVDYDTAKRKPIKVSKKFRKMCDVYKHFSKDWKSMCDYSEESMLELFISESYGDVKCEPNNGYYIGKQYLNVSVAMWKEDIPKGLLFIKELYQDPDLPDWWLDKVFKKT